MAHSWWPQGCRVVACDLVRQTGQVSSSSSAKSTPNSGRAGRTWRSSTGESSPGWVTDSWVAGVGAGWERGVWSSGGRASKGLLVDPWTGCPWMGSTGGGGPWRAFPAGMAGTPQGCSPTPIGAIGSGLWSWAGLLSW